MAALVGFLIAFPLVVSGVFTEPTQVIALLSGPFGTIVGLVGTYFGVKSSGDTNQRAQELARAMAGTLPETTPMGPGLPWKVATRKGGAAGKSQKREALRLAREFDVWRYSYRGQDRPTLALNGCRRHKEDGHRTRGYCYHRGFSVPRVRRALSTNGSRRVRLGMKSYGRLR